MNTNQIQPVTQRFVLHEDAIAELKAMKPQFGFNGLGEVVFRRTYSRDNEDWADVVIRVIQGAMSIRKEHYLRNTLRWDDGEWQSFARDMAISLFKMEWMPPGRGLWMMGTDFAYQRGSMALNNCAATDTVVDVVHSAEWTMDALMNGVGVGFTTYWRGEITEPDKKDDEEFVVPDTREGWVQSLIKLLCAYINSPRYGTNKFPLFDYSQIRPAGAPIKGFGGLASGPGPLRKLHERVESYCDALCRGEIVVDGRAKPYNHTRFVADLFNAIGACVVAGNVRRSAEISMGDVNDSTFINLKNYQENPERGEIGWMSNNSVILKPGMNYEDFSAIPEMARRIIDNGEPGMVNLVNVQKYGRYGKPMKDEATLTNPCVSGETLIAVADGRNYVPIAQLAKEGQDVPVYSMDPVTNDVSIKWGRRPRVTGENQKLLRIHFRGRYKGQYIDVTPNHQFILNDGRKIMASELRRGDSIPQFKKGLNGKDDYVVIHSNGQKKTEHRMIKEFLEPELFQENYVDGKYTGCCRTNGVVVHHLDENKSNNHPDNLEITTPSKHSHLHGLECVGENNPMYGRQHTEETKRLIGLKARQRCEDPAYRAKLSAAQTPERRAASSEKMIIQKFKWDQARYDEYEQIALVNGLRVFRDDQTFRVIRTCENDRCTQDFNVPWHGREQAYCSRSCANTKADSIAARKKGQTRTFTGKAKANFHRQAMIYKDLVEQNPCVMKRDWEQACREAGVTFRFNRDSPNPWIASGWRDFKQMVNDHNHRVSHIEELDGLHTVYNITVDDNHTFATVTKVGSHDSALSGVFTVNCGEISLNNMELCNLAETFPPRCSGKESFYQALRYATFYASTVSLLPTHRPETNAVVTKNRRIGVSISGIAQWASGEVPEEWGPMNYTKMTTFLRHGYGIVLEENTRLAHEAGIPPSIRVTTVKPSGTISLLAGVTPGVHYPVSRYAIRRMRIGDNSPLVQPLIDAGIPHEKDQYSDNTLVFEFVIDHGAVRPCEEVSPWEQFSLVAMLQRCWADNCVSATVYFDKVKDAPDVEKLLAMYIPQLKSVSMLPHAGHGYAQAPYEPIDRETYLARLGSYQRPDFSATEGNVPEGSKYCTGDKCMIPIKK